MSGLSEITMEWVEKADHDLGSAKIIFLNEPDFYNTIAFHCQQAVEKYLKAILTYLRIEFEGSLDLIYLLELISSNIEIDELKYKDAFELNSYCVHI